MSLRRILPIIIKEFRQIRRDRISLGLLLGLPAFLMFIVGYALNFDVKNVQMAVFDQDRTPASREFVRGFTNSGYFTVAADTESYGELERLMMEGRVRAALVVPADFSAQLLSDRDVKVQILMDGSNSNTASIALGYMVTIVQTYSSRIRADFMARNGMEFKTPVELRPKIWYNPELASKKFLIPGYIGFILMLSAVVSTALSLVKEKEYGTMEQLAVSPLRISEIVAGKTVPYFLIALVSSAMVLLMAWVFFDIEVRGRLVWLYLGIVVFLVAALGQGLLISAVAENQQIAFFMAVLSTILPTFLLSGLVFPIKSMPVVLQWLSNITPTKFFIIVIRAVMLKGVGPDVFWRQLAYMGAFAIATLVLAGVIILRQRRAA